MSSWGEAAWQGRAFGAEGDLRDLRGLQIRIQTWVDQCTCPACSIIWQHYWSQPWIIAHFGLDAGPITCPQCGGVSISGQKVGVRQRYQPDQTVSRPKPQTFWQKVKALSEVPAPVIHELTVPSEDWPTERRERHARSRSSAQVPDSQADSPQL